MSILSDLVAKGCSCGPNDACSSCPSKVKFKKPPKWTNVYPQGTAEGDEEQRFFIALARDPKWDWRSVAAVATEARLTEKRTEQILAKYHKKGMVFQSPTNETLWAYWERVPGMLPVDQGSVASKDQKKRIKVSMKKPN